MPGPGGARRSRRIGQTLRWAPLLIATAVYCGGCDEASPTEGPTDTTPIVWKTYEAPWFSIEYPAHFRIAPSLRSEDGEGYDSVFFEAPDGGASFYVLSPQWGRKPTDVLVRTDRERELMVDEEIGGEARVVKRTIVAKDGSYSRFVEEHEQQDGIVYWVTGFEYRNADTQRRYRPAYEHFKASLQQFAD